LEQGTDLSELARKLEEVERRALAEQADVEYARKLAREQGDEEYARGLQGDVPVKELEKELERAKIDAEWEEEMDEAFDEMLDRKLGADPRVSAQRLGTGHDAPALPHSISARASPAGSRGADAFEDVECDCCGAVLVPGVASCMRCGVDIEWPSDSPRPSSVPASSHSASPSQGEPSPSQGESEQGSAASGPRRNSVKKVAAAFREQLSGIITPSPSKHGPSKTEPSAAPAMQFSARGSAAQQNGDRESIFSSRKSPPNKEKEGKPGAKPCDYCGKVVKAKSKRCSCGTRNL